VAASEGNLEAVVYLVSHGADPTLRDFRNNNALDDARSSGNAAVIEYLSRIMGQ
jgi:ankyrin repeat protein